MSWKTNFSKGMKGLREGDLEASVICFSKALDSFPDNPCIVYDARSIALEKLGRYREALRDVRKTIELAPNQYQGYFRGARLFYQLQKYSNALTMAEVALDKCTVETKKADIQALKTKASRRATNHSAILPVELFAEIVYILLDQDSTSILQLSHVCQYWRSVIHCNPSFWRTLVLGKNRPAHKARLWAANSLGRLRDLHIKAEVLERGWSGQGLEDVDWVHLRNVNIENWDFCGYLRESDQLSKLTSVERCDYGGDYQTRPFEPTWPLQHLGLYGTRLPACFNEISPEHLRSLTLLRTAGQVPIDLTPYTSLEKLVLHHETRAITGLPQRFSTLQHLELFRLTGNTEKLLDVPMPELRILNLNTSPIDLTQRFKTLAANTTQLTQLILSSVTISGLIPLLQRNPTLESLEITKANGVNSIVRVVTEQELCPHLAELNLSHCPDLRTGSLSAFIRTRNPPGTSKVRKLVVDGCEGIEAGKLEWFRDHVPDFSCVYRTKAVRR